MKKILSNCVAGSLIALSASTAMSYEKGDMIFRSGMATVNPSSSGSALGFDLDVDDDTAIGFTGIYMIRNNVGVELLASTPFEHDINLEGTGLQAGSTKHLPPTLSVQYFPLDSKSKFQPYVGLGINWTIFFDEDADSDLEGVLGSEAGLHLDNSVGLTYQVGFDYAIDDKWLVNASYWSMDIDTDATLSFNGTKAQFGVEIDPNVLMIGVGYKF